MPRMTHKPLTREEIREVRELTRKMHADRCGCDMRYTDCLMYAMMRGHAVDRLYPLEPRRLP